MGILEFHVTYDEFAASLRKEIPDAADKEISQVWEDRKSQQRGKLARLEFRVLCAFAILLLFATLIPPVNLIISGEIVTRKFEFLFWSSPYYRIDSAAWFVEIFGILSCGFLLTLISKNLNKNNQP